jgi:deoxyribodipyrimidine photolyase-related protein
MYRTLGPAYANSNVLRANEPLPLAFTTGHTHMRCVSDTLTSMHTHGYAHHIQRLMVLANLATLAGVNPQAFTEWMHGAFIDAYDWVMVPNVIGMGTFADGGMIATKPYVSSGAYIDKMSRDYCTPCAYDRTKRVGDDACPFTTLYWDFLDRNRDTLGTNHRLAQPYANLKRIDDMNAVRARARHVIDSLRDGTL